MSTEDPTTATADPEAVERALRVGLEDFELSDEDRALLDRDDDDFEAEAASGPLPVVAVILAALVPDRSPVAAVAGRETLTPFRMSDNVHYDISPGFRPSPDPPRGPPAHSNWTCASGSDPCTGQILTHRSSSGTRGDARDGH